MCVKPLYTHLKIKVTKHNYINYSAYILHLATFMTENAIEPRNYHKTFEMKVVCWEVE